MVIFNESLNNVLAFLPPIFSDNVEGVLTILKALGILAVVYLIYLLIMISIGIRKIRQLNRIRNRMENMDYKLDLIIHDRKIVVPEHITINPIEPVSRWNEFKEKIKSFFKKD